ncbi:hypothetical protein BS78_05G039700 [Paspalum vaginatum]|nr:hypothetical protein BS78_05G039700 [Paspalum vaginatum]
MDGVSDGGTTVSRTVATAAEGPHHAQQLAELGFNIASGWLMPSVWRHHRAAMSGTFGDAWSQRERNGDGDGAVVGEEEEDDDDDGEPYGGWLLGAVPASGDAMAVLPETTVGGAGEEECCAVCLEEYAVGDALRTLPSAHGFHGRCILGWLRVSRLCPLCRFTLPAEEEDCHWDSEEEDDGTLG